MPDAEQQQPTKSKGYRPQIPYQWLNRPGVQAAIADGKPHRVVAELAGVSRQAVSNYIKAHIKPAREIAWKAQRFDALQGQSAPRQSLIKRNGRLANEIAATAPYFERVDYLWDKCRTNLEKAEQAVSIVRDAEGKDSSVASDLAAVAPLLNQAHRNLELLGKATGVFGEQQSNAILVMAAPGSNVTINTGQPAPDNRPDTLEAVLDLMPDEYAETDH